MAAYANVTVDYGARFNKRLKDTHRFSILGTGGVHELTAPLENVAGMSQKPWGEIRLSRHGEWWRLHWAAIYSAYGRTPFFEFYEDDFKEIFSHPSESLQDFNMAIDAAVRGILDIPAPRTNAVGISGEVVDLRTVDVPKLSAAKYYQVWSSRHGFTPHLSVLDLIFNMGPEAPLILHEILKESI